MNHSPDNRAQSLAEWLEQATNGLVAPARERIKLEIEAHYAEAVEARLAEGMNLESAEPAALEELGDVRAAAKAFRKQHVTGRDAAELQKLGNSYHGGGLWKRCLGIGMFLPIASLLATWFAGWLGCACLGSCCVLGVGIVVYGRHVCLTVSNRFARLQKLLHLGILEATLVNMFAALFYLEMFWSPIRQNPWAILFVMAPYLLGGIYHSLKSLRLLQKLRRLSSNPESHAGA